MILVGTYLLVYVLLQTLESYIYSLGTRHHHSNNTSISNSLYDHVASYLIYHLAYISITVYYIYIHCVLVYLYLVICVFFLHFQSPVFSSIFSCIIYSIEFRWYLFSFISRVLAVCYLEHSSYVGAFRIFGFMLPTLTTETVVLLSDLN